MTKLECPQEQTNKRRPFLVAISFIVRLTKPIFELRREFDRSNPYVKFGRNPMKNDQVRVTTDRHSYKWWVLSMLEKVAKKV